MLDNLWPDSVEGIAVYGAVIATVSILWQIVKEILDRRRRPRLTSATATLARSAVLDARHVFQAVRATGGQLHHPWVLINGATVTEDELAERLREAAARVADSTFTEQSEALRRILRMIFSLQYGTPYNLGESAEQQRVRWDFAERQNAEADAGFIEAAAALQLVDKFSRHT